VLWLSIAFWEHENERMRVTDPAVNRRGILWMLDGSDFSLMVEIPYLLQRRKV
jgi:hypothetical protein